VKLLASVLLLALVVLPGCATMQTGQRGAVAPQAAGKATGPPAPRSIKASAVVEINRIFTVKGRALIAAQRPDRFRIEVLGPMNSTVALFVSDGTGLYIFSDGQSARYYWNDARVPFPFRPEEVVDALLGARPADEAAYGYATDDEGRVTELIKHQEDKDVLRAEMTDYRKVSGRQVPFFITMKDRRKDLGVRYSSVEVDPDFAPGFFDAASLP